MAFEALEVAEAICCSNYGEGCEGRAGDCAEEFLWNN